jgi:hypothetical protein
METESLRSPQFRMESQAVSQREAQKIKCCTEVGNTVWEDTTRKFTNRCAHQGTSLGGTADS